LDIKEALASLDTQDDALWTADGAPKVDVVAKLVGNADLKRKDITDAAPNFSRTNPDTESETKPEQPSDDEPLEFESDVEQAKLLVEEKKAALEEARGPLKDAQTAFDIAQLEYDEALQILETVTPPENNQKTIMDYLASQNAARVKRAEDQAKLRDSLGDLAPDTRATIDKAFTRRNKRGLNRPGKKKED
jgi:hypothetical protein